MIKLNNEQQAMLNGNHGVAKQMAMRLVLDLAAASNAEELVPITSAHLSGVSPLTGGLGLRQFLAKLTSDPLAKVAIPTTLNSAGTDGEKFATMRIVAPDFLEHNNEIVSLYEGIGVRPTQSCIPYEWDDVETDGVGAWAESNAICFGNSYCGLLTNRESGLSALAASLTGYTPKYGLLLDSADSPNLIVNVTTKLNAPSDFSVLGDWIGKQRKPSWFTPLGPIPWISGLPKSMTHEQRKALTAAAANYGCPKLYLSHDTEEPAADAVQDTLEFDQAALDQRYAELAPTVEPDLIVIGCPQASVGELRAVAKLLKGKTVLPTLRFLDTPLLWVFTSEQNKRIADEVGITKEIERAGALLLINTCPEVVPYDRSWIHTILSNSMKAEHYIKSGLNGIPTAVLPLTECIAFATGERELEPWQASEDGGEEVLVDDVAASAEIIPPQTSPFSSTGNGLPSQTDFDVTAEAFVTDTPITLLGFVNRQTGVIEEDGHPANGESMAHKIAIFPKGSGSTVAPYVLLELFYRGNAPVGIINTQIDQQSAPACSLEGIPYGYDFDADIIGSINHGDTVRFSRHDGVVSLEVIERVAG